MENKRNIHQLMIWLRYGLLLPVLLGVHLLPAQEQSGLKIDGQENSAVQEDVNEFLGYEDLILIRYLSLPYDTVMNTNMVSYFVNVGFMLIIFIPLIFFWGRSIPWKQQLVFLFLAASFLFISVPSAFLHRTKIDLENAGEYIVEQKTALSFRQAPLEFLDYQIKQVFISTYHRIHQSLSVVSGPRDHMTYPVLFTLLLVFIWLLETRTKHLDLATKTVLHFLLIFGFLWLLLSSGIPWYGLLLFPLMILFIVRGMHSPARGRSSQSQILLIASAIWIVLALAYRFSNYEPNNEIRAKLPFIASVSQYQIGRQDKDFVFDRLFPQFRAGLQLINQEKESYIYRVGTLMPFFIQKNDRRVFSDNFLDFFQSLEPKFPNHQELALALKAYGFEYIIIDLNLSINDNTPERSLEKKFQQFMNFIYQNPRLQLIATDRITRTVDGQVRFLVFPDTDTIEYSGSFAIFKII